MGLVTNTMPNTQNRVGEVVVDANQRFSDAVDAATETALTPFEQTAEGIRSAWDSISSAPGAVVDAAADVRADVLEILNGAFDVARYGAIAYAVAALAGIPLAYYAYKTGLILKVTTFVGEILNAVIRGIGLVV